MKRLVRQVQERALKGKRLVAAGGRNLTVWGFSPAEWLVLVQYELLLFAAIAFAIGAIDEWLVDLLWLFGRATGRIKTPVFDPSILQDRVEGKVAVFVPTWQEARVIGTTLRHMLSAWPDEHLTIFVGCYLGDDDTIAEVHAVAQDDPHISPVIHRVAGPTTKADCLNAIYRAMLSDEQAGQPYSFVILHDAEDLVDPLGLALLRDTLADCDFVQLPVAPLTTGKSRFVSGHYADEFAEAHGKALPVREMLNLAIPAAGVGCGIRTEMLARLADADRSGLPFAPDCLTEDYELGLKISDLGGCTRFARASAPDGRLIATRSYFPTGFYAAVRQKTRWIHGIALQGWDRMGWSANPLESWMRLRDRRGPMLALTLLLAYLLIGLVLTSWLLQAFDLAPQLELGQLLAGLLTLNIVAFLWRAVWRFAFTARKYGLRQGLLAILRIPAANVITIMAGHRAVMAYCKTFLGGRLVWEKTEHPEIRSNLDVDRKSPA